MPLTQRVSETRKRYGDSQAFLKRLNPDVQPLAVRHPERAYTGTAPTLSVVRATYTEEVAELWLMAQVENMNDFCGVSRKMTLPQMQELARMMLAEVPYLKTSELLLFFHRFKAGHYGEFFGVVDPQRVLSGLQAFLRDRRSELERMAPQHPAVRAARLREGARRGAAALSAQQDAPSPSQRDGRVDRAARPRVALYLLRGGSLGVAAAIALVCCGLLVGVLMGMASPSSAAPAAQEPTGTTTTVVRPGESLWEIAAASGTADVSGMVTRIVELNDLQSTTVRAGQTLEIPAA